MIVFPWMLTMHNGSLYIMLLLMHDVLAVSLMDIGLLSYDSKA